MKTLVATVILVALLAIGPAVAIDWITNPANGHGYAELPQKYFTGWLGAEELSVFLGGHLVTINDAEENEWIRTTFNLHGGTDQWSWIGLYEMLPYNPNERQWVWSSGDAVTYSNWGSGEPSSSGEHWVAMDGDGWWRDLSEGNWPTPTRHIAIVEVVPEPSGFLALVGAVATLGILKRR